MVLAVDGGGVLGLKVLGARGLGFKRSELGV